MHQLHGALKGHKIKSRGQRPREDFRVIRVMSGFNRGRCPRLFTFIPFGDVLFAIPGEKVMLPSVT